MGTPFLTSKNSGRAALSQTIGAYGCLPARLDSDQAAALLGFSRHDIPILIAEGFLKPLGRPAPNATKYFATVFVQELAQDAAWLNKATQCVYEYWRGKNAQKAALSDEMPLAA